MGVGMEHAPLAIFTTLAPMAAASFVVLAYVFLAGKPSAEEAKRLDKWTALPAVFMALGMIASFFHLANPANALFVFSGVGSSPLSNELLVTVVFAVVALVYWILGLAGKLPATGGARTVLLLVLAAGSVLQALFCGMAYLMDTIPTWNNPATVVQQLGCAWLGGAALGALVCAAAKVELPKSSKLFIAGFGALGLVVALAGVALQSAGLESIANIWGTAAALEPQLGMFIGLFALCGVAACALLFFAGAAKPQNGGAAAVVSVNSGVAIVAVIVAVAGILIIRFAFYGLFMGIAI